MYIKITFISFFQIAQGEFLVSFSHLYIRIQTVLKNYTVSKEKAVKSKFGNSPLSILKQTDDATQFKPLDKPVTLLFIGCCVGLSFPVSVSSLNVLTEILIVCGLFITSV